jgi:hypothetical protein
MIAFRTLGRSRDNGEQLRTTAVRSSVQVKFAIPKVSNFLRPSPFPVAPLPCSLGAILAARRTESPMLVAWAVRYLFRGLSCRTAESTGEGGTEARRCA